MRINLIRCLVIGGCTFAITDCVQATGKGSTWTSFISVRSSWTFNPGSSTIDTAPGEVEAAAIQFGALPPAGDPPPCRLSLHPVGIIAFPVSADAADLVTRGVSADAVAVQNFIDGHAAASTAQGFAQSNAVMQIAVADFYLPHSYPGDVTCDYQGSDIAFFLSGATAGTSVTWHLVPPSSGGTGPTLLPTVSVVWTAGCTELIQFIEPEQCNCDATEIPTPACPGGIFTIQLVNRVYVRNSAGIITVLPINGVFATRPSGNTRLGFLTDSAFDPVPDGSGGFGVTVNSFPLTVTLPTDAVEVGYESVSEVFGEHDGDLTPMAGPQGKLTWNDRRAFISIVGAVLNSNEYNARADFDLDGDIDETDYSAFLVIFNTNACLGDFNADGTLDTQDIFDFLNAWFLGGRDADFNNTIGVTTQDIFDFLAAWNAGTGC